MPKYSEKNQAVDRPSPRHGDDRRVRVTTLLRECGVSPTKQRVSIGLELLLEPAHLSAEDIARRVAEHDGNVSRATVYNTLRCFVDHGLVCEVNVGTDRVFYDSNTAPHHHFYDPDNGELTDIDRSRVSIDGMPEPPDGRALDSVELVIRLKPVDSGTQ